jgi:hypothetical protein
VKYGCRSFIISVTKLLSFKRQFCVHLYRANKRTILNTYKTFKLSFRHVSAHYVPSSKSVFSQVLKTKTNGVVTKNVPSDVLDVSYAFNTMHFGVIKTMYCKINGVNQLKKIIFCFHAINFAFIQQLFVVTKFPSKSFRFLPPWLAEQANVLFTINSKTLLSMLWAILFGFV